jgi:hypothetical protein
MKWFGKPKCFICNAKIADQGAELQYKYNDEGIQKTGSLPLCTECAQIVDELSFGEDDGSESI